MEQMVSKWYQLCLFEVLSIEKEGIYNILYIGYEQIVKNLKISAWLYKKTHENHQIHSKTLLQSAKMSWLGLLSSSIDHYEYKKWRTKRILATNAHKCWCFMKMNDSTSYFDV